MTNPGKRLVRRANRMASAYRRSRFQRRVEKILLRLAPTEPQRLFGLTIVVGAVCGLVAVAFHLAIRLCEAAAINRAMTAPGYSWVGWTLVVPTAGGLLGGVVLQYVVPGARGSGIPQVKAAYVLGDRDVPLRDAVGKFLLSSVQIGTGASLGREGPTVHICAGVATALGRLASISPRNLRRLLPVGAAAGVAAAFNAPISAVTFTVEEVVGSLDQTVLSGVVVAAAVAAITERGILGENPVLGVEHAGGLQHVSSLAFFALLGVAAGLVSVLFTDSLLSLRRWFRAQQSLPVWAQPAAGALGTGAVAVAALSFGATGITGGGYEVLGRALSAQLGLRLLLALCALKLVATVLSYSSGGAGGIFAPSLFIGGMLGGAVGYADRALLHHSSEVLGGFALVGMGAVFAGIVRAPITSVLIIFEMTGSYGLILPLMLSNMTAYALARRSRPTGIYDALLEQDGIHLPRPRRIGEVSVGEVMSMEIEVIGASMPFDEIVERLRDTTQGALPVAGRDGEIIGLITLEDLRPLLGERELSPIAVAADICRPLPAVALPSDSLETALERMTAHGMDYLPVMASGSSPEIVGMLTLREILSAETKRPRRPSGSVAPAAR